MYAEKIKIIRSIKMTSGIIIFKDRELLILDDASVEVGK